MADGIQIITKNRRATFDFEITDRFEAGLVLTGSEVKALRKGTANVQEAFVKIGKAGADLVNCYIAPYEMGGYANHEPRRMRRLLLHGSEIEKLKKGTEQKGMTIVPIKLYFKDGRAKLELALGKGKKTVDKRHSIAERESKRRMDRALKSY
ncbi:SsrA-binding protein SmpB [Rubrivirga sp.]|uniref:SsrA-binding protein SmpB n=1 Tax=Rubrivirga sp. TaxID=1885344 RepID=UPI003C7185CC